MADTMPPTPAEQNHRAKACAICVLGRNPDPAAVGYRLFTRLPRGAARRGGTACVEKFIAASVAVMLPGGGVSSASAQQDYRVGLVIGYPASVGVFWHVSDGVALRPDVTLNGRRQSRRSALSTGGTDRDDPVEGWTTAVGLSALFYLGPPRRPSVLHVPRAAHVWSSTETGLAPAAATGSYASESMGFWRRARSARTTPPTGFRLFGELGLGYMGRRVRPASRSCGSRWRRAVGLRSGVGVVVFF